MADEGKVSARAEVVVHWTQGVRRGSQTLRAYRSDLSVVSDASPGKPGWPCDASRSSSIASGANPIEDAGMATSPFARRSLIAKAPVMVTPLSINQPGGRSDCAPMTLPRSIRLHWQRTGDRSWPSTPGGRCPARHPRYKSPNAGYDHQRHFPDRRPRNASSRSLPRPCRSRVRRGCPAAFVEITRRPQRRPKKFSAVVLT